MPPTKICKRIAEVSRKTYLWSWNRKYGDSRYISLKNLGFLSEQAPRVWWIVVQDSSVINWKFAQKNQNTYEIGCRSSRTSSVYERRAKVQLMLVKLGGLTSNRNGCGCVKGDAPKEPSCFISMLWDNTAIAIEGKLFTVARNVCAGTNRWDSWNPAFCTSAAAQSKAMAITKPCIPSSTFVIVR